MRRKVVLIVSLMIAMFASTGVWSAPLSGLQEAPVVGTGANAIPGRYIVVFKPADGAALQTDVQSVIASVEQFGGMVHVAYSTAVQGFAATLPPAALNALRRNPRVGYIEADQIIWGSELPVAAYDVQLNPPWGLDRIDQRSLPLDQRYSYTFNGQGVHAYVINTGIDISHPEFEGRASVAFDAIGDGQNGADCNGLGTHLAGTIGGKTYGAAKQVRLYAVRVLNCQGSASTSQVLAGLDWVAKNHQSPSVANFSVGSSASETIDTAVRNTINTGVVIVVGSGSSSSDACNFSPARVMEAITVAATDSSDTRLSSSNYGRCLDLFAPGGNTISAAIGGGSRTISGTSPATAHTTGVAALYRQSNPGASPSEIAGAIVANATSGKVQNPGIGSPNLLLYSLPAPITTPTPRPSPTPTMPCVSRLAMCTATPRPTLTPTPGWAVVFSDDFERNQGWALNPHGSDTATVGRWERGDPEGTNSNGPKQLGTTPSGANDLVTGRLAGIGAGAYDIDGGTTSILSPYIKALPPASVLTFQYYLAHGANASSEDFLRVKVVDGNVVTTVFEMRGAASDLDASWQRARIDLGSYSGKEIRILIEAADAGTASLVEAAVDDVTISFPTP